METNHNQPESLNDMVFEGRNKAYGAYQLRKSYNKHLTQASFYSLGLFVFLFTFPALVSKVTGGPEGGVTIQHPPKDSVIMVDVILPDMEEVKQPEEPATPQVAGRTVRDVAYRVVEATQKPMDEIPTQDQLKGAVAGLVTTDGLGEPVDNALPSDGGTVGGTGTAPAATGATAPNYFISVERMPEFEGGMDALMKFVGKNLRYPPAAQKSGVEGTVVLTFVVSPSGEIGNIEVLKGLGYGTEEEVVRVIKKMPRWKPGIQNGNAVPVKFTLPIRLQIN
ncbi:energy transducer TonB [Nibribacter koreensis]